MTNIPTPTAVADLDVLRMIRATVLVTDRVGNILRAHGGGGRPLGFAPEQLEGHNGIEFIAPDHHGTVTEMYSGAEGLPLVANPEPFPLHIVGPDGLTRIWDCMPGGFGTDEIDGWILTLTCRKEQNPSITAMDCYIAGGTPTEIATAVAHHYRENSLDVWRKSALVLARSARVDGTMSAWRHVQTPVGSDPALAEALGTCIDSVDAPWNLIGPGETQSGCALPDELRAAAEQAGVPYCTLLASGLDGQTHIVFVRLSNFEYELQGNNKLADRAIDSVLTQALQVELSRALLDHAMRSDPLTGISNQLHFEEVVDATTDATRHAALFIDIDHFKSVNDTFGHSVGDEALREVAARLTDSCRPHDMVARVGGDEFGIILRDVSAVEAHAVADRIRASMRVPFDLKDGPAEITVTVGIAPPSQDATLKELVRAADHAMLADKPTSHPRPAVQS